MLNAAVKKVRSFASMWDIDPEIVGPRGHASTGRSAILGGVMLGLRGGEKWEPDCRTSVVLSSEKS